MILVADRLAADRGGRRLFAGFSHAFARGAITVVLGRNGTGKSTLLRILAGIEPPDRGEVRLDGTPIAALDPARRAARVAWQGEPPPPGFGLTVRDRIELAAPSSAAVERAARALSLADRLDAPLEALSSGERMRAELAAVVARDAPVWLLDEPTAHLDLDHARAWLVRLRAEAEAGRTIVVVLHDLLQAQAIADALLLFDRGRIVVRDAPPLWDRAWLEGALGAPLVRAGGIWLPRYTADGAD